MMRPVYRATSTLLLIYTIALACAVTSGCATSRGVRPMGEGHLAAGASLGGPLFVNLAVPVVAPLASVFARFGVTGRTDVDLGIMLPVGRAAGIDLGAAHLVVRGKNAIPYVMTGARAALLGNARSWVQKSDTNTGAPLSFGAEVFEELYVHASWDTTPASYAFVGADLFAQVQHNIWRPSVMGGFVWRARAPLSLQVQIDWLALHRHTDMLSLRYVSLGGLGALGVQVGLTYDFGRVVPRAIRP